MTIFNKIIFFSHCFQATLLSTWEDIFISFYISIKKNIYILFKLS